MHPSYAAVLRRPMVSRILAAMVAGRTAGAMAGVVFVVAALELFTSAAIAGFVVAAGTAPAVIVGPIAGALLDRHGRVRLIVASHLAAAAGMAALAVLAASDQLSAPVLILVAAAVALVQPLSGTGPRTLLPLVVERSQWDRINALDSIAFVLALLAGPSIGGIAVATLGIAPALFGVAVLNVFAALAIAQVHEPARVPGGRPGLLRDAWRGLTYTWHNRTLRRLTASMASYYVGFGVLSIVVPVVLLGPAGGDASTVGLAWAVSAVGGAAAAFVFGRRQSAGREGRWLARCMLLTSAACALLLAPLGMAAPFLALGLVGVLQGPIDVAMFSLRQRATDPEWLGRSLAVSIALNGAGSPIAASVAGVTSAVSIPATVLAASVAFVAGALLATRIGPAGGEPENRV